MIDASTLANKRENYRQEIRRDAKKTHMRNRRAALLTSIQQLEPIQLPQQQRESVILNVAEAIVDSQPNPNWGPYLEHLLCICANYKQDYSKWIDSGIVNRLVQVFRPQYRYLEFYRIAAQVLANMVCWSTDDLLAENLSHNTVLLEDMLQVCDQDRESDNYIYYLSNITAENDEYKDLLLKKGIAQLIYKRLSNEKEMSKMETLLWFVSNILRDNKNIGTYYKNLSYLIPCLNQLVRSKREETVSLVLFIAYCLCSVQMGSSFAVANIYHASNMVPRIMQMLGSSEDPKISQLCLKLISQFACSSDSSYAKKLIQLKVLDRLQNLLKMKNQTKLITDTLWCITNLVIDSRSEAIAVIEHPVFDCILEHVRSSNNPRLKCHALYVLDEVLKQCSHLEMQTFIQSKGIIVLLIESLEHEEGYVDIIYHVLNCLKSIVQNYSGVYTPNDANKMAHQLQKYYNITQRIEKFTRHPNSKIANVAEELYQIIGLDLN